MNLPARISYPHGSLPTPDHSYPVPAAYMPPPPPADITELLRKLWRRKGIVLLTTLLCGGIAVLAAQQIAPRFTAIAQVMVGVPETRVVKIESVVAGISADAETVQNETYVIRSRELAERVVNRLALDQDPEFNPELAPPPGLIRYLDWRTWVPENIRSALAREEPASGNSGEVDLSRQRVVDSLLDQVDVSLLGRSHVLSVEAESKNPVTASKIANALTETYIEQQLLQKTSATQRASGYLDSHIAELRKQVETAERAVEEYRRRTGLFEGRTASVSSQQLTELNTQMIIAQSSKAEAEAKLRQAQSLLKQPNGSDSAPEVLNNAVIGALKQQETEVNRKAAELSASYGEKHPMMQNAQAQVKEIQQKIRIEVGRIIEGLRNEAASANARYQALRDNLDRIKSEMGQQNGDVIRLRALEREADASRTLFESFLARSKETDAQKGIQQPDAKIVSRASIPEVPSFPPKKLILFLGAVGGFILGVLLALLVENLDRTFRSGEEVEELTGLPTLAMLPTLPRRSQPTAHVLKQPISPFSESLRKLHAGLVLSDSMRAPKVIMVASATPGEGKTALGFSLARLLARTGRKIVVVDCDWRRPQVHRLVGKPVQPGLAELLSGHATPEEVVHRDAATGAHAICAGRMKPEQTGLYASDQMRLLLHTLSQHYDLVIVDTPPVLVGAEVLHLARMMDRVVYTIRWGHTRRDVALSGLKQLLEAQAKVAGVVLSNVDPKQYRRYGYGQLSYQYVRSPAFRAG